MTREEAIEYLKRADTTVGKKIKTRTAEALDMAIKALEQEPCGDCISKQAVLDEMYKRHKDGDAITAGFIKKLPSVTPQPKMGRWIRVDKDKLKCSECEVIHLIAQYPNGKIGWCPNCGAKMQEVEE